MLCLKKAFFVAIETAATTLKARYIKLGAIYLLLTIIVVCAGPGL